MQLWCYNEGVGNLWHVDCMVMKKWFACLTVAGLLFSVGVGEFHAESWYALDTDQYGRTGYIDNDSVDKNDVRATLRLKIVDPNVDHSIYTMTFNRVDKTVQLIDVTAYNPQGYMIGSETLANTKVQIQEGSNLNHVYHLIW